MTYEAWRFTGAWRHYQELCLEAFEADRAAGETRTLLVAPPGSGKTLIGLEIVRRLGLPAVVLCPTQTIQRQWRERQALFGTVSDDVHLLTYQSLCRADDPDGMLRAAAERHWLQRAGGRDGADCRTRSSSRSARWSGAARRAARARGARDGRAAEEAGGRRARARAVGRRAAVGSRARAARGAARGRRGRRRARRVPPPRLAVGRAAAARPRHAAARPRRRPDRDEPLRSDGGRGDALPGAARPRGLLHPHAGGRPRGPPRAVPGARAAVHAAALRARVARRAPRALPAALVELDADLSTWLLARLRERRTAAGAQLSWAGVPAPPAAARRGRAAVAAPRRRARRPTARRAASASGPSCRSTTGSCCSRTTRCAACARRGTRRSSTRCASRSATSASCSPVRACAARGGEVDRVLLASGAKPMAMCDALAAELERRGDGLRAVVFCDSERPPRMPADSPLLLTGGGRGLLAAAGEDDRLFGLRPALVTAQSVRRAAAGRGLVARPARRAAGRRRSGDAWGTRWRRGVLKRRSGGRGGGRRG